MRLEKQKTEKRRRLLREVTAEALMKCLLLITAALAHHCAKELSKWLRSPPQAAGGEQEIQGAHKAGGEKGSGVGDGAGGETERDV